MVFRFFILVINRRWRIPITTELKLEKELNGKKSNITAAGPSELALNDLKTIVQIRN